MGKECLYPGHCTFAYCQEEIDVWTLEQKGFISRELLFDPCGLDSNVRLTLPKILQEHRGIFMFLCGVSISGKKPSREREHESVSESWSPGCKVMLRSKVPPPDPVSLLSGQQMAALFRSSCRLIRRAFEKRGH